ncbi:MAG: type 4a pilus biogenesis protein PilO [Candidatus Hydrogenedentales bacterium]|jgi:Tfp pilus assembly protein PilO
MTDIQQGKVTRRDLIFVATVILIAALLFVAFYFFGYRRINQAIDTRSDDLKTVQANLKQAEEVNKSIDLLREEAQEMKILVDIFEDRLPDEREIPRLLNRFELLGAEIGLRVQLSSLPTSTSGDTEIIPYKVTAYGQFHQIATFINMLERDERYLKVSELDINEEKDGVSSASFILSTFRFISKADTSK